LIVTSARLLRGVFQHDRWIAVTRWIGLTLLVFALVDLSLWRIRRRQPEAAGFAAPGFVPPVAALVSILMVAAEMLG
jgi:amino acid transporter